MKQAVKTFSATLALPLALLLAPTLADAADMYFEPYMGAGAGNFQLTTGGSAASVSGGYVLLGAEVNHYLCPELRIGKVGNASTTGYSSVKVDWFATYLLRLQAPINAESMIYGLGGATTMSTALTTTAGTKNSSNSTHFSYGVGLEFWPGKHLAVSIEWMRYSKGYRQANNTGLDMTGITGQIRYSF